MKPPWMILLLVIALRSSAAEPSQPASFSSAAALPSGWRHVPLPKVERANAFRLVMDGGVQVLEVRSAGSASTLSHTVAVDPAVTPWLRWRWKVSGAVPGSDLRDKVGDDYAGRLYVFFDYDPARLPLGQRIAFYLARSIHGDALPAAALCYVWGTAQQAGTIAPNPYTDRLRMVVLESGDRRAARWVIEVRDIAADFAAAFGEPAPAVTGIAIGADTDNTGATVTVRFGDISFGTRP